MVILRAYRPDDLDALYDICLTTADAGKDASADYSDPQLVGHIYAAPYGVVEPERVILAEDEMGVAGYIVGTFDTPAFAAKLEQQWWPALRARYAAPSPDWTAADRQRVAGIKAPEVHPADLVATYPAHIHMNLRARLRGQGVGTQLLQRWVAEARAAGVPGIHLGASTANTGGVAFWTRSGFGPLIDTGRSVWMGMTL
ncbi:GNAT family N-acetyltransferase [Devosia sp. FKR38]|uniref:GNAT family N-acetyltransferase n=1 Tax=Devosia sp. FKR38 TaxID=2562312 RepID=UPI0010BF9289|nr:GNAT family N-acetyltransferase [Devosia sp. FKR38]